MLTVEQIGHLRQQILTELALTIKELSSSAGNQSVGLDQTRVGRLSRMDALQQQAMAAGLRERLVLKRRRLEAALFRTQEGTYGKCCQCGDPIALERLQADLGSPFCLRCQNEISER